MNKKQVSSLRHEKMRPRGVRKFRLRRGRRPGVLRVLVAPS